MHRAKVLVGTLIILFLFLVASVLIYYLGFKQAAEKSTSQKLNELFEEYLLWRIEENPSSAKLVGITGYDDEIVINNAAAYRRKYDGCVEFLRRSKELDQLVQNGTDRFNLDLLQNQLSTFIEGYQYKGYVFPVTFLGGPQLGMQYYIAFGTFDTEKKIRKLIRLYRNFPEQADEYIELMREGIREGRTLHKISMEGVIEQFEALQVPYDESPLYKPFKNMPAKIPEATSSALREEGREVLETLVLPAFQKLGDFIENVYMLHLRPEIAVTSLPDGDAYYKQCLKFHTSTDMTARDIHQLGLREVERIEGEMAKVIRELNLNYTVKEFSEYLRTDPNQFYTTQEDLLDSFRYVLFNKVTPQLPDFFLKVPKRKLRVNPLPRSSANGTAAYYISGFMNANSSAVAVNAANLNSQPKYEVPTLSIHEGVPGHHLQSSYLHETEGVAHFHKLQFSGCADFSYVPTCFPLNTAYIEGWALYAEDLGFDLGLYKDPYARYGHYSWEIFRACRLVVDTGMHTMGWTRQQAVDFMRDHSASSLPNIINEVNRYITWPGQACAYKIGELKIQEMKMKAKQTLGKKFSIKKFHDVLLTCPGPMQILERCVDKYVKNI